MHWIGGALKLSATAEIAARAALDKKGTDVVVLEVGPIIGICDSFVIASGSNPRQVQTIVEEIERQVKAASGEKPRSIEGREDAYWVLMDFGDVIVHVFRDEAREYYQLERLWSDAPSVQVAPAEFAAG